MSEYIKDQIKEELTNLNKTLKHLYDLAEKYFSFYGEVEKLRDKQMRVEEILSEVENGNADAIKGEEFISSELNNSLFDLKKSLKLIKLKFQIPYLAVDSFNLLSKN